MSSAQPHCCETKGCQGKVYNGWFLNCRFCQKKIVVECLRFKDELRTKQLLTVFGLMKKSLHTDGTYKYTILAEDPNNTAAFSTMFNVDSPFGITCEVCINKFTQQHTRSMYPKTDSATQTVQSTSRVSTNQSDDMDLTQMQPSKVIISRKPIVMPKVDENGLYCFYLANTDTKASSDSIVAYIMETFKLSSEVFKVVALPSKRIKRKTYNAFKLIVFTEEICELLRNNEFWTVDFRVRPFDKVRNTKNKPVNQSTDKHQTKIKPNSSVKSSKQPNNTNNNRNNSNNNNNNNISKAKPRNNNQRQMNNHRDRNPHRKPRNVRNQTNGNHQPSNHQCHNSVSSNGFQTQFAQQQQQQNPMNFNYGQYPFWNAMPYHYPHPQMFAHNLMPFQMNQQMCQQMNQQMCQQC